MTDEDWTVYNVKRFVCNIIDRVTPICGSSMARQLCAKIWFDSVVYDVASLIVDTLCHSIEFPGSDHKWRIHVAHVLCAHMVDSGIRSIQFRLQ